MAVRVNDKTVFTDFVVLKDTREEEKCGPDTVLLGWPFLFSAKIDISIYRRVTTYDIGGRCGILRAMENITDEYIIAEVII